MFALTSTNLPRLRSYAAALKHYESAPEQDGLWRGLQLYDGSRRSSSKRDTSKRIRKELDGTLSLRYHHTDLVCWHPDNTVSFEFHGSASSQTFASCFTPLGLHYIRRAGTVYIQQTDGLYLCEGSNARLRFKEFKPNVWACVNPHAARRFDGYTLDLKKAAAIRKKLKPFLDWSAAVERLSPGSVSWATTDHTACLISLQDYVMGEIKEIDFTDLRFIATNQGMKPLLSHAYVLGRAVKKETLPLGSLPKASPYAGLMSWRYV